MKPKIFILLVFTILISSWTGALSSNFEENDLTHGKINSSHTAARESIRSGNNIIVDSNGGGDYKTIQAAIDNASSGDSIYVWTGTYYENIIVNKSITMIGNGSTTTIINGSGIDMVVCITEDWVNLSGFSIYNNKSNKGIYLANVENVTINNNNCSNNIFGTVQIYCQEYIFRIQVLI
jgi:pectin methylesterase-like acyl-CoA thioesterase